MNEVALDFSDVERIVAQYVAKFGELPSEHLRRKRHAKWLQVLKATDNAPIWVRLLFELTCIVNFAPNFLVEAGVADNAFVKLIKEQIAREEDYSRIYF